MIETIKIANATVKIRKRNIGGVNQNSVDARELHEVLQVKSRFNDWILKRIRKTMFQEAHDYYITQKKVMLNRGSTELKEYHISIEMAKHLAMMENTPRGYAVRQHFINAEKSLTHVVDVMARLPFKYPLNLH